MMLFWIRKSAKDPLPPKHESSEENFRKHDRDMKKFREVHPEAGMTQAKDWEGAEEMALVLIPSVKFAANSQN